MKRKRAVKLLMSVGVSRNTANFLMRTVPDLPILFKWIAFAPRFYPQIYSKRYKLPKELR